MTAQRKRVRVQIQVPDLRVPSLLPMVYAPYTGNHHVRWIQRDSRGLYTLFCNVTNLSTAIVTILAPSTYLGHVLGIMQDLLTVEIVDEQDMRVACPGPFRILVEYTTTEESATPSLPHVIVTGQNAPRDPSIPNIPKEAPQKCRTPACRNWSDQGRFDVVLGYCGPCDERRAHTPTWPLLAPSFARLFAGLAHPEVAAILASKESHLERPKVTRFTRREALARNRVKPKNWWET